MWGSLVRGADVVPTNVNSVDLLLNGGFRVGRLYFLYGEEKSGKTSLTLTVCASAIGEGLKPFFIDCSMRLHPGRVAQVLQSRSIDLSRLSIKTIQSFREQAQLILNLYNFEKIFDVIVLDDFTYQHRLELSRNVKMDLSIYKKLALQVAMLSEIASRENTLIIIVGQVHDMPEREEGRPIAYRILSHWAEWVLKLQISSRQYREIIVEKPEKKGPGYFTINEAGIGELDSFKVKQT